MEVHEKKAGIDGIEIFRLDAKGGVEIHYRNLPIVTLLTNGNWGYVPGVKFDANGLRRLAGYLNRYADRLENLHPGYTRDGKELTRRLYGD